MAIDIQPPNYSGLVAIAGKNAPLNIQPTGALGLQALQQGQANQAALRATALGQAQLQQQGQLGLLSNQTQQRALDLQAQQQHQQGLLAQVGQNLDQQKLAQQGSQFDASMGMDQQKMAQQGSQAQDQLDLQNRILAENTAKDQMVKLMAENKEAIQEKGAFANYGILAMKGAKTPDEAAQIKNEIIQEAVSKKFMTPEEAKVASQLPISQFQNGLMYKSMQYSAVKDLKDANDFNKPAASAGVNLSIDPNGGVQYSSTPTPATTTSTQEKIDTDNQMLQSLGELKKTFNSKYLTYSGRGTKAISQEAEKLQGIPGLGTASNYIAQGLTGLNAEDRAKYIDDSTQYLHSAGQLFQKYIQSMAGSRVSAERIKQFEALFANPSMSPTEYKSGISQLLRDIQIEKEGNQNILKSGIDVTSPPSQNPSVDPNAGLRAYLKQHGKSDAEINAYLNGGK